MVTSGDRLFLIAATRIILSTAFLFHSRSWDFDHQNGIFFSVLRLCVSNGEPLGGMWTIYSLLMYCQPGDIVTWQRRRSFWVITRARQGTRKLCVVMTDGPRKYRLTRRVIKIVARVSYQFLWLFEYLALERPKWREELVLKSCVDNSTISSGQCATKILIGR